MLPYEWVGRGGFTSDISLADVVGVVGRAADDEHRYGEASQYEQHIRGASGACFQGPNRTQRDRESTGGVLSGHATLSHADE